MLRELQLIVLVALVAVLVASANPRAVAEAELREELRQSWASFHAATGLPQ